MKKRRMRPNPGRDNLQKYFPTLGLFALNEPGSLKKGAPFPSDNLSCWAFLIASMIRLNPLLLLRGNPSEIFPCFFFSDFQGRLFRGARNLPVDALNLCPEEIFRFGAREDTGA